MKKSILVISLLSSTFIMYPDITIASGIPTYTHTYTPELKPISSDYVKLAAVCFLGTGGCGSVGFGKADDNMDIDTGNQCKNEGFVSSCSTGYCMDGSCSYNKSYGKCLTENCPTNSATSCSGAISGKNACGVDCKQCCLATCPNGYDYTESQLTGGSGNGWVKDGTESCDHCSRGKLYKRKTAPVPPAYTTCPCGGANQFNSGGTYYYSSCNCCSNCSGYNDNASSCSYGYNTCRDNCTGQPRYQCKSCDNSCSEYSDSYSADRNCSYGYVTKTNNCGNNCYYCIFLSEAEVIATSYSGSCYVGDDGKWCWGVCYDANSYRNGVLTSTSFSCHADRNNASSHVCFSSVSSYADCESKKYLQSYCRFSKNYGIGYVVGGSNTFSHSPCTHQP